MWKSVDDRFKRKGSLWTTHDHHPTQKDLRRICEYVQQGTFAVAYEGQSIRHFRLDDDGDLHFLKSEGYFRPDGLPRYCTDKMAAFLHGLPDDQTFAPREVAHLTDGDQKRARYFLLTARKEGWVEHISYDTWVKSLD